MMASAVGRFLDEVRHMSKWTPLVVGSLFLVVTACSGNKGDNNTSGAAETGTMQGGTATDTGMVSGGTGDTAAVSPGTTSGATGGESADTARNTGTSDRAKANQTKSGVTDTKTGKSTLGKGVTQTSPDQNQPVTAKGDTIRSGNDSTKVGQQ
jgi:hypothetical protein